MGKYHGTHMLKAIQQKITEKIKEHEFRNLFGRCTYPKRDIIDELITENLFQQSAPQRELFFKAMRHNFSHHFRNSSYYRKICFQRNFVPGQLDGPDHVWNIPFILSDIFKFYNLQTRSSGWVRVAFTSSGTSGHTSRVVYNIQTARRILFLNYFIYKEMGLVAMDTPTNYLMFCPDPAVDSSVGTSNSDLFVSRLAPAKAMFFSLGSEDGAMTFKKTEAVEQLRRFVDTGYPVRMLGFMYHICEVILTYHQKYGKVNFPDGSYILYGGGWKRFAPQYGDNFDLFAFLKAHSNIELKNVRDVYSLNEHGIFYLECEHHHKHVPNLAWVCARDPQTLHRLPNGEMGLLHLYTPVFESYPGLSILTTDYGTVGEQCLCGRPGTYVQITGRAGLTKKTTCALTAEQLIRRK